MKKVTLLNLVLDNFRCFKHKEVNFSSRTFIKGRNGIGKSTLYNSVMWLLFNKSFDGTEAKDIRPKDKDGNDIHFIDICVSATFDVDGTVITLTKTQKEKYNVKRGTSEKVFQGNENLFEVNGIPKSAKDFSAFVNENFCAEDVFLSCSNASSFFKLDTKKRRAKLMQLVQGFTEADVIATSTEFSALTDMLNVGTVDELIARSKGTIKRLNDLLNQIPARIDEQEKSKVDIDVAELELQKNDISVQIKAIDEKLEDLSKAYADVEKANVRIMEINFEMNDIKRKANEELAKKRRDFENTIANHEQDLNALRNGIQREEQDVHSNESLVETYQTYIQKQAAKWKEENNRVFDDSSLVCPYCGQEYQEDKKNALRDEFKSKKAAFLAQIESDGTAARNNINICEKNIENLRESIEKKETQIAAICEQINSIKSLLSSLPNAVDVSDNEEYVKLQKELEALSESANKNCDSKTIRASLLDKKSHLTFCLDSVKLKISQAERNVYIDERITELQESQRDAAQKIADEERTIDLLERFNRAKMDMLTNEVNKHFSVVRWKLFQPLLNGGTQDVCKAIVGGSDRETTLNDSDCILADLDILQTFQKMSDISLPTFLDRAESINKDRIPTTAGQLIVLAVSDDKEMKIESEDI